MKRLVETLELAQNKIKMPKPKPIHLYKNNDFVDVELLDKMYETLNKEWPAALQDCHEDEYYFITSDMFDSNDSSFDWLDYFYEYSKKHFKSAGDGFGTRGICVNYKYYAHYIYNNKSVFLIKQGTNNRQKTNWVLFADEELFENICKS